jgi:hypothetical protein
VAVFAGVSQGTRWILGEKSTDPLGDTLMALGALSTLKNVGRVYDALFKSLKADLPKLSGWQKTLGAVKNGAIGVGSGAAQVTALEAMAELAAALQGRPRTWTDRALSVVENTVLIGGLAVGHRLGASLRDVNPNLNGAAELQETLKDLEQQGQTLEASQKAGQTTAPDQVKYLQAYERFLNQYEKLLRGRLETGVFSGRASSVLFGHERTEAVSQ